MYTEINYLYRDADNYKMYNFVCIPGMITADQIKTMISCLDSTDEFIPRLVGFPETRFKDSPTEADHSYFELNEFSFVIKERVIPEAYILPFSIDEMVERFKAVKGNWICHSDFPPYFDPNKPLGETDCAKQDEGGTV